jgi:hypothetical protein
MKLLVIECAAVRLAVIPNKKENPENTKLFEEKTFKDCINLEGCS